VKEPQTTTLAGLPAVETEVTGIADGRQIHIRITFAWDSGTQYQVNCEYEPERMQEMTKGCDQVLRSFSVSTE
jgi:hypothetical protein